MNTKTKTPSNTATHGKARTVIYCHGIFDKPAEDILREQWDRALFGVGQGERTRMAYWVDRSRYPESRVRTRDVGALGQTDELDTETAIPPSGADDVLQESIDSSDSPKKSEAFAHDLENELAVAAVEEAAHAPANLQRPSVRAVGPKGILTPITSVFTKLFLADVNDFLFNKDRRNRMLDSVKSRVETGGGPFVVIGHSQGSMVVYQALMELGRHVEVELLVTLGSPLGLASVTGELKKWHQGKLPIPSGVKRWVNVARNGDIVCADATLAGEYKSPGKKVEDLRIRNFAWMPAAHDSDYYLAFAGTREAVLSAVDRARFQPVSGFTVASGLTGSLDAAAGSRVPVLIELRDRPLGGKSAVGVDTLDDAKKAVLDWIEKHVASTDEEKDGVQLEDTLDRYVAAHLTRAEVERLSVELGQHFGAATPSIYRMFENSRKKALICDSVKTIQARTAHYGYGATGKGITWAVLDTGLDADHPHFGYLGRKARGNIAATWDCTKRGPVRPDGSFDMNGHGTHVAGILAGGVEEISGGAEMIAVAPEARIVSYKVLSDDGGGNDAWIIKAIDHIVSENEKARRLVVHGVNLSLGGPFDAASFGCGDSPLCASLSRLIGQGVVVVIAAGNEGIGRVTVDGFVTDLSLDLSIGDPANLEEAIAVGSVHPTRPHRYGTSYFSSRGPTADGRAKPDVVAPGERIQSCRSGGRGKKLENLYLEMSGTSMAAPHVSGLIAAFLSARPEFIGHPGRVKEILLSHCTDLRRDRYHQGAGLPNLTKMLLET